MIAARLVLCLPSCIVPNYNHKAAVIVGRIALTGPKLGDFLIERFSDKTGGANEKASIGWRM
jgi:hypothetical protein